MPIQAILSVAEKVAEVSGKVAKEAAKKTATVEKMQKFKKISDAADKFGKGVKGVKSSKEIKVLSAAEKTYDTVKDITAQKDENWAAKKISGALLQTTGESILKGKECISGVNHKMEGLKSGELKKQNVEIEKISKKTKEVSDNPATHNNIESKRMENVVEIRFKCPENADKKEFKRQLKGQERGLNGMYISKWFENRNNYVEKGRAPESEKAQLIEREKARESRIRSHMKEGMSRADATKEAESWISTQAALHNPDQIAGGDPDKVSRMGDANINKSIGSQWRSRVGGLEDAIKSYAEGKSPEELAITKLNVRLIME